MENKRQQIAKSALVFLALQEVAIEEIQVLEGTPFYKGSVKNSLANCKKILEKSVEQEYKNFIPEEEEQLSYFAIWNFMEKWSSRISEIKNAEELMNLDLVLEHYVKGEYNFIGR